jgi:hypothetical protein
MKSLAAVATIALIVFATANASAQSSAPGTPSKPNTVTSVPPPPPPPGGPDKVTTQPQPPRPGVGDLTGDPQQKHAAKSYCYISESADKCVGWLTACMSPQSGSFSCAAGPGDNGQYVCVCVRH